MNIEPIVFFDLVIAILILATGLIMLVISYVKTLQKSQSFHKEGEDIRSQAYKKAELILEDARNKGLKIIANAQFIEGNTKNELYDEIKALSQSKVKSFEKASLELLKTYKQELDDLKVKNIEIVENITKSIERSTLAELKDFEEILKEETFASQKIVEGKTEEDYKAAQKAIETYKTERLKEIEDQIYEIIERVSKLVLSKALTLEDHEQLVIDALNKARKEEVL